MQFVSANDNTDDIKVLGASEDGNVLQAPTETKSYTDLNNTINGNSDNEISLEYNYKFSSGDWQHPSDPKTGINITRNLVINGNGAVIDGGDASSLFNISEGVTVTLKNLTITHAAALVGWSEPFTIYRAIESKGTLYLEDCTFTENSIADEWKTQLEVNGSVIHSNKDVFIDNCIFYNNKVQSCGVVYTTGRVFVNNSEFDSNEAYRSIKGVAIYAVGTVSINNTYFGSNDPKVHNDDPVLPKGGAIYTETGIDVIENCEFENNYGRTGGAIYIANPDAVTSIKNSTFYGNGFNSDMGGAIYTKGKIDVIEDSEFDTNHALVGAGIYATSINKIDNSTFDNNGYNNPDSKGGAIYLTGNDDLFINNSHIDDNLGWEGAGIYTHGGVTVLNSNLTHNAGDTYQFTTKGSSIYANGDVYIENVTMRDNFAVEGGVVYSNGTVTIKNSKDIGNNGVYAQHTTSKGGVVYAKGDVYLENTTFGENTANLAGGAVYSEGNVNF
ncbi:right-handed parallel beta-helix repeat-containing protein [uncultured Methanobrevibacter sp.]|uniref:right-handed parallel beta-helix repeat-containing protein n=1 Tax=uncultured Methanobrevibacter sp. TaxID=253161 RepID=UPI0025FF7CC6|nr:right-handed parallel beta-helix repeat-containing protein [uncultured Methanobrevibacter sp.]